MLKTTARCEFLPEGPFEREPAGGAGNIVRAAQDFAIHQNARTDARADGEKDRITAAARRALPGFAQNVRRPVAVNDHGNGFPTERGNNLRPQRVIFPAGNVWRPDPAGFRVGDARNADPDDGDATAVMTRDTPEFFQLSADESSDLFPAPGAELGGCAAKYFPVCEEERGGQFCAAEIEAEDNGSWRILHDSMLDERRAEASRDCRVATAGAHHTVPRLVGLPEFVPVVEIRLRETSSHIHDKKRRI